MGYCIPCPTPTLAIAGHEVAWGQITLLRSVQNWPRPGDCLTKADSSWCVHMQCTRTCPHVGPRDLPRGRPEDQGWTGALPGWLRKPEMGRWVPQITDSPGKHLLLVDEGWSPTRHVGIRRDLCRAADKRRAAWASWARDPNRKKAGLLETHRLRPARGRKLGRWGGDFGTWEKTAHPPERFCSFLAQKTTSPKWGGFFYFPQAGRLLQPLVGLGWGAQCCHQRLHLIESRAQFPCLPCQRSLTFSDVLGPYSWDDFS